MVSGSDDGADDDTKFFRLECVLLFALDVVNGPYIHSCAPASPPEAIRLFLQTAVPPPPPAVDPVSSTFKASHNSTKTDANDVAARRVSPLVPSSESRFASGRCIVTPSASSSRDTVAPPVLAQAMHRQQVSASDARSEDDKNRSEVHRTPLDALVAVETNFAGRNELLSDAGGSDILDKTKNLSVKGGRSARLQSETAELDGRGVAHVIDDARRTATTPLHAGLDAPQIPSADRLASTAPPRLTCGAEDGQCGIAPSETVSDVFLSPDEVAASHNAQLGPTRPTSRPRRLSPPSGRSRHPLPDEGRDRMTVLEGSSPHVPNVSGHNAASSAFPAALTNSGRDGRASRYNDVFVPRPDFCRRVLWLYPAHSGLLFLYYPEDIPGEHYQRKTLRYSLCLVFHVDQKRITVGEGLLHTLVRPYSVVLTNIAEELREAEVKYAYISRGLLSSTPSSQPRFSSARTPTVLAFPSDAPTPPGLEGGVVPPSSTAATRTLLPGQGQSTYTLVSRRATAKISATATGAAARSAIKLVSPVTRHLLPSNHHTSGERRREHDEAAPSKATLPADEITSLRRASPSREALPKESRASAADIDSVTMSITAREEGEAEHTGNSHFQRDAEESAVDTRNCQLGVEADDAPVASEVYQLPSHFVGSAAIHKHEALAPAAAQKAPSDRFTRDWRQQYPSFPSFSVFHNSATTTASPATATYRGATSATAKGNVGSVGGVGARVDILNAFVTPPTVPHWTPLRELMEELYHCLGGTKATSSTAESAVVGAVRSSGASTSTSVAARDVGLSPRTSSSTGLWIAGVPSSSHVSIPTALTKSVAPQRQLLPFASDQNASPQHFSPQSLYSPLTTTLASSNARVFSWTQPAKEALTEEAIVSAPSGQAQPAPPQRLPPPFISSLLQTHPQHGDGSLVHLSNRLNFHVRRMAPLQHARLLRFDQIPVPIVAYNPVMMEEVDIAVHHVFRLVDGVRTVLDLVFAVAMGTTTTLAEVYMDALRRSDSRSVTVPTTKSVLVTEPKTYPSFGTAASMLNGPPMGSLGSREQGRDEGFVKGSTSLFSARGASGCLARGDSSPDVSATRKRNEPHPQRWSTGVVSVPLKTRYCASMLPGVRYSMPTAAAAAVGGCHSSMPNCVNVHIIPGCQVASNSSSSHVLARNSAKSCSIASAPPAVTVQLPQTWTATAEIVMEALLHLERGHLVKIIFPWTKRTLFTMMSHLQVILGTADHPARRVLAYHVLAVAWAERRQRKSEERCAAAAQKVVHAGTLREEAPTQLANSSEAPPQSSSTAIAPDRQHQNVLPLRQPSPFTALMRMGSTSDPNPRERAGTTTQSANDRAFSPFVAGPYRTQAAFSPANGVTLPSLRHVFSLGDSGHLQLTLMCSDVASEGRKGGLVAGFRNESLSQQHVTMGLRWGCGGRDEAENTGCRDVEPGFSCATGPQGRSPSPSTCFSSPGFSYLRARSSFNSSCSDSSTISSTSLCTSSTSSRCSSLNQVPGNARAPSATHGRAVLDSKTEYLPPVSEAVRCDDAATPMLPHDFLTSTSELVHLKESGATDAITVVSPGGPLPPRQQGEQIALCAASSASPVTRMDSARGAEKGGACDSAKSNGEQAASPGEISDACFAHTGPRRVLAREANGTAGDKTQRATCNCCTPVKGFQPTEEELKYAASAALCALAKFSTSSVASVQSEMRRLPVWKKSFNHWSDRCMMALVEVAILNSWLGSAA